jgi:hypothetical protein
MSNHKKLALAYALLCVALIAVGFGPLEDWQMAARNGALVAGAILIVLVPAKAAK